MPAASSTVDLSRLPVPAIVDRLDFETIRSAMIADLQARLPDFDAIVESDPAMKQIDVFAYRELLLRQTFDDRARQLFVAYATDSNVDQLGALFGVARLEVSPAAPLTGAPAVMESDAAFRQRIVLAPESYSVAGPASAYVFHALSADATIADASCSSPMPGEVVVTILSALGSGLASTEQIEAVTRVVTDREIRPLTDLVTVRSAELIPYVIEAELTLFGGPDPTVVLAAAQARVADYVAVSRSLGRDITRSALFAALHAEGVQRAELIAPAADIVVDQTHVAHCAGIDISVAGNGF